LPITYAADHNFRSGVLNPASDGKGVLQNSFNFGFADLQAAFGGATDFSAAGRYDVKLQVLEAGTVVMENAIQVVAQETASMASLDSSAYENVNGTNYMFVGNGNPVTGFRTVRDEDVGLEMALKAKDRTNGTSTGTGNVYQVDAGTVGSGSGTRAKWAIDFSLAGDTDRNGTGVLDNYIFKLLIDVDPTAATRFVTLDEIAGIADNNFHNVPGSGQVLNAPADAAFVQQNSTNLAFFASQFNDPATAATETYTYGDGRFDVRLQAFDRATGAQVLENAIIVVVGDGIP